VDQRRLGLDYKMITQEDIEAFADSHAYWAETPDSYPTPLEMVKHYQKVTQQEPDSELYIGLVFEELFEWEEEIDRPDDDKSPQKELKELV